jgi:hypothetical protein
MLLKRALTTVVAHETLPNCQSPSDQGSPVPSRDSARDGWPCGQRSMAVRGRSPRRRCRPHHFARWPRPMVSGRDEVSASASWRRAPLFVLVSVLGGAPYDHKGPGVCASTRHSAECPPRRPHRQHLVDGRSPSAFTKRLAGAHWLVARAVRRAATGERTSGREQRSTIRPAKSVGGGEVLCDLDRRGAVGVLQPGQVRRGHPGSRLASSSTHTAPTSTTVSPTSSGVPQASAQSDPGSSTGLTSEDQQYLGMLRALPEVPLRATA